MKETEALIDARDEGIPIEIELKQALLLDTCQIMEQKRTKTQETSAISEPCLNHKAQEH